MADEQEEVAEESAIASDPVPTARTMTAATYAGRYGAAFTAWLSTKPQATTPAWYPGLKLPATSWEPLYSQFMAHPTGPGRK